MDATTITILATGTGTAIATVMAVVGLVSRSIGGLRSHMDHRIDALTHANQQAHDAIGLRIDALRGDLGGRIDAQDDRIDALRGELGARIDAQGTELGKRIEAQGNELGRRIEAQGAELNRRIEAQGGRIDAVEVRLAGIAEDVSFIKGRLTGQSHA